MFGIDFTKIPDLFLYDPNYPLLFGSSLFLFLFFALLVFYRIFAKSNNARILVLIIFSLYFYYMAGGVFLLLLIANAILNFYFGKGMGATKVEGKRRNYLLLALLFNLGLLVYFKYSNFFIQLVNDINLGQFELIDIILPIGISFYTFKSLSYILDIYLEAMEPTKSFRDYFLFVTFFPNILAGPIDRAAKFLPQINKSYSLTRKEIALGLMLIMMGLIKKIMIADYISLNFVDRVFDSPVRFTGVENLLAVYGYALQLYCDFSGYSDIAIGIALLLGFKLMENFNYPFKAKSISEFWRRWHISLSSWLLDYVFRPLQITLRNWRKAGNITALIITFVLVGFWHGASWAFLVWGLLHGIYMAIGMLVQGPKRKFYNKYNLTNSKILGGMQIFITFNLVAFSFIFFRANSFESALEVINQILFFFKPTVFIQFVEGFTPTFILLILGFLFHFLPSSLGDKVTDKLSKLNIFVQAIIFTVVIWVVTQVQSADLQPFIYFQF
ncbi:MAG: MBOAT family protein [Melioribacteraceae bacterium]|nr:MBOAT family protein [Melioribacteraceae bacterium]